MYGRLSRGRRRRNAVLLQAAGAQTLTKSRSTLPKFLSEQGIAQIIPPLLTKTERLWAELDTYNAHSLPVC